MATSYPGAVDTPTDPTSGDTMDGATGGSTVFHDVQHTNTNDAIVALENALGFTGKFNFLPVFNVRSYGATGNGSTDDTAHIQAAITAAGAAGGGIVLFPVGNYLISSSLTLSQPNVVLQGMNDFVNWVLTTGSVIKVASTMTNPLIAISGQAIAVKNLAFATTSGNATANVISINGTVGSQLADLTFKNLFITSMGGITGTYFNRTLFEDVVVQSWNGTAGFNVTHASIVFFNRCNASPASTGTISTYIYNYFAQNCGTLNFVACEGNGQPYYQFYMDTVVDSECWNFEGNGATQDQLHFTGGGDWSISQCYIAQPCVNGLYVTAGGGFSGLRIIGCHFDNFSASAIVIDGTANVTQSITVLGCFFNWESTTGPIISLTTQVQTVNVVGCIFEGSATSPVWFSDASTRTGRYVTATGNTFNRTGATASVTGTLTNGVVKICDNSGFNPVGTLSVSVPASGTAVASSPYDRTFYVTGDATNTVTLAISGGPTFTLPALGVIAMTVPAGTTLTPTYTAAHPPTWVVEGL